MLTLAFDTSNNIISGAILEDETIIDKINILESGKQAELLVLSIEEILHRNKIWYQDLDLVTTCNGSGSFTGVRIGLTCARTIKIATKKPLILVNSCEVLAYKYRQNSGKIFVINDAKMDECFCSEFLAENNRIVTLREPFLVGNDRIFDVLPKEDFLLCGTAKSKFTDGNDDFIEADIIGLLAAEKFKQNDFDGNLDPLYLRMPRIEARKR